MLGADIDETGAAAVEVVDFSCTAAARDDDDTELTEEADAGNLRVEGNSAMVCRCLYRYRWWRIPR